MSDRTEKIGHVLSELIATYIQQEANTDPLITVTRVDVSPDLSTALVFITTIPDGGEKDALIFLKRHAGSLRKHLKDKAYLKRIPHLDFMLDAGERQRQRFDELLKEIKEKK